MTLLGLFSELGQIADRIFFLGGTFSAVFLAFALERGWEYKRAQKRLQARINELRDALKREVEANLDRLEGGYVVEYKTEGSELPVMELLDSNDALPFTLRMETMQHAFKSGLAFDLQEKEVTALREALTAVEEANRVVSKVQKEAEEPPELLHMEEGKVLAFQTKAREELEALRTAIEEAQETSDAEEGPRGRWLIRRAP